MLILKPNCELCDIDLPPASTEAMICSYECTFCVSCVDTHLKNVCPNCGGGFVSRPIRPANEYRENVSLIKQPGSAERVHSKLSPEEITALAMPIYKIPPEHR